MIIALVMVIMSDGDVEALHVCCCSGLQPVPRYRKVTKTALKVLDRLTGSDVFHLVIRSGNSCSVQFVV